MAGPAASIGTRATPTPAPTEPFTIHTGKLPAGRYLQPGFDPPLSFTIGPGWQAYFDGPTELYFENTQGDAFGADRVKNVVDPKTGAATPAPEDLGAWLKGHPAFDDVTLTPVTVAGLPGTLFQGTATATKDLYAYPDGNFRVNSGARYAIYVVPMDGPNLVITTLVGARPASFDAARAKLQAIVDSLRIVRS